MPDRRGSAAAQGEIMAELLNELRDLVQERSIRQGDFVLASGIRSKYYCDTKSTTLSPEGSLLVGQVLYQILSRQRAEAVGGLAIGAAFIATAVALVSAVERNPIYGFTVREKQKEHGLKKEVEESFHPDGRRLLSPGRRVAVVDDVVTKGGSIFKAIEFVESCQCEIVSVIAIVDRNQGGGEMLRQKGLPFQALFTANESGILTVNDELSSAIHSEPAPIRAVG